MKKLLFIIILSLVGISATYGQTFNESWEFTNLFAADDSEGTTHLYYHLQKTREYYCVGEFQSGKYSRTRNIIRHHDTSAGSDSTLIQVSGGIPPTECFGGSSIYIHDFHPFNGDPANAIFAGVYGDGFEPYGYVQIGSRDFYIAPLFENFEQVFANPHFGSSFFLPRFDGTYQVPITEDEDTLNIINNYWYDIEIEDSLSNYVKKHEFQMLGLSPFDDSLAFYQKEEEVFRSQDLGRTEESLDINISSQSDFYFDADSLHIYLTSNNHTLLISDDYGKQDSWTSRELPSDTRYFLTDPKTEGLIFFADSGKIYKSTNYAENFELLFEFDRQINGFYKKPGEDILYVLFPDQLVKIDSGVTEIILEVPSKKTVTLRQDSFPYKTGDIFVFRIYEIENYAQSPVEDYTAVVTDEVMTSENEKKIIINNSSATPLFSNMVFDLDNDVRINHGFADDRQFVLKNNQLQYDPWIASSNSDSLPLLGIYREISQSRLFDHTGTNTNIDFFIPDEPDTTARIGNEKISMNWSDTFGFTSVYLREDNFRYYLKGAVIDDVVYGDTTRTIFVSSEPKPEEIPVRTELHQNYPNPFNPVTTIQYELPVNREVTLEIFDMLGRRVAVLVDEFRQSGIHKARFDASGLSSGIYVYRLATGNEIQTRQMVLVK